MRELPERTLTREELTAALAARQLLLERAQLTPAEAIRRLTPLQAQFAPAPYIALAARLDGFHRDALEAAFAAGDVVKTTIMRTTLHAVAADEYAAYAQLSRQAAAAQPAQGPQRTSTSSASRRSCACGCASRGATPSYASGSGSSTG